MKHLVADAIFVVIIAGQLVLGSDVLAFLPRKFGITRYRGPVRRLADWLVNKVIGEWDDYGEFRSKAWKKEHGIIPDPQIFGKSIPKDTKAVIL